MATNQNDPNRSGADSGAQVYREKKGGIPWWAWLLAALLLLWLLYALFHHSTQQTAETTPAPTSAPATPAPTDTSTAPATPATADTTAATATPTPGQDEKVHKGTDIATAKPDEASTSGVLLSDVVPFATATDPMTFVGRRAKLTNVPVQKVLSNRVFFVGPTAQQQMLVLLDKTMDAGTNGASKVTIASGKPVSLVGVVEKMPAQDELSQKYQISGADYTAIQDQKAYLHATVAQEK